MNYKFNVEYDGSRYLGWQRLGKKQLEKSIQGKIELVLSRFYEIPLEEINLIASGRTDAGVHARAQVANVHLPLDKKPKEIEDYLNKYLPEDIRIYDMQEANERFHSRFNAKKKIYHYNISIGKACVFNKNYVAVLDGPIDLEKIKKSIPYLLGSHDFMGFCSLKKTKKSTIREIYSIEIEENNNQITFKFTGNGFLQNMIRIIMGTLIEIGEGKREISTIDEIFNSKQREDAGFLAQAKGLTLMKVFY